MDWMSKLRNFKQNEKGLKRDGSVASMRSQAKSYDAMSPKDDEKVSRGGSSMDLVPNVYFKQTDN